MKSAIGCRTNRLQCPPPVI